MALDKQPSFYFAYGSNMWLHQMITRCPDSELLGVAILEDWKWIIDKKGFANIIESSGDSVYGLVFTISESDEEALDKAEHVPDDYTKEYHAVTFLGRNGRSEETEMTGLIYVDRFGTTEGQPRPEYVDRMNKAIADAIREGVPEAYIDEYLRKFIHRN